jgi:hypothetical protein
LGDFIITGEVKMLTHEEAIRLIEAHRDGAMLQHYDEEEWQDYGDITLERLLKELTFSVDVRVKPKLIERWLLTNGKGDCLSLAYESREEAERDAGSLDLYVHPVLFREVTE